MEPTDLLRAEIDLLKSQFKTDLDVQMATAKIDHDRKVFELEGKVAAFNKEAQGILNKEVSDHRKFLEDLEKTRNTRTVIFGTFGVAVIGAFFAFVLSNLTSVANDTRTQAKAEAKAIVEKVVNEKLMFDQAVAEATKIIKDEIAWKLDEQTASAMLAQLGNARNEAERASRAQNFADHALHPEDARELLYMIDGLIDRYFTRERIGSAARREALMLTVAGIGDLASGNAFSAKRFFERARLRDPKLPDPYLLLAFDYSREYKYLGGGKWEVANKADQLGMLKQLEAMRWQEDTAPEIAEHVEAQHWIAKYYKETGQLTKALELLKEMTARHRHPATYRLHSVYTWLNGDASGAVAQGREAIRMDPAYTQGVNNLLFLLTHEGVAEEVCSLKNATAEFGTDYCLLETEMLTRTFATHPSTGLYHVYLDTLTQAWFALWLEASRQSPLGAADPRAQEFGKEAISAARKLLEDTAKQPLLAKTEKYERSRANQIIKKITGRILDGKFQ